MAATAGLGWGHVNLNVSDLDRSIAFYEKLGFEVFLPGIPYLGWSSSEGSDPTTPECARALGLPESVRARACIMQLGDGFPKLDLTEVEAVSSKEPLANADLGFVRLCLASRDLHDDYARLSAEGVTFVSPPVTAKGGMAEIAVCRDPDGALIELIELHLERWQAPSA